jgi:exodeoxyribonuclease V gamma subunit
VPVPLAIVRRRLEALLAPDARSEAFLAGGVTFAALKPNRPVPARIVVLLGMNDGAFPREVRPPSFDLCASAPRRGDRVMRDEARYAVLAALLGARERLLVSWTGRSARDNTPKPPSVMVSELRDVVARSFSCEGEGAALDRLTTVHPLQAFSRRYFLPDREPHLWSYADQYAEASGAAIGAGPLRSMRRLVTAPLVAPATETEVSLERLVRGLQDPARRFLRDRLGIVLREGEAELDATEPFALGSLEQWTLRAETYALMVAGASREDAATVARERGRLPHGAMGDAAFHACLAEVVPVVERVRSAAARGGEAPLPFRIEIAGTTLRGTLSGRFAHGLALGLPGKRRARHWLEAWVAHLVFHLADPRPDHVTEQHALDGTIELVPVREPREHLAALVQLWQRAVERPLPFFCESSFAYAQACTEDRDAQQAARRKFTPQGDYSGPAEREKPYIELAWRGVEYPLDTEFESLACEVFLPVLEHARPSE